MVTYASVMSEPAVVAALVSVLVALLTPWVSERIRARTQGRMEAASVTVRKLDGAQQFYAALQARLEATEAENDELNDKLLRLERVVIAWDARFTAIADDLGRIRATLESEGPELSAILAMVVRIQDVIQRREHSESERAG